MARHDIARRKFCVRVNGLHEAAARFIDEDCAFAAQRFSCKRCWIAANRNRGRMELHEFSIRDHRTCTRRHAEAFAARFQRVCRHRIERTQSAGCKDHGRRAEQYEPCVRAEAVTREQARDTAIFHCEFDGMKTFEHVDRAIGERMLRKNARDFRACAIAFHMHDAGGAVRGFAANRERAVCIAIERRAVCDEIIDTGRGFARNHRGDVCIAKACACRHRVGGVCAPGVAFADGGRDTALRPSA